MKKTTILVRGYCKSNDNYAYLLLTAFCIFISIITFPLYLINLGF